MKRVLPVLFLLLLLSSQLSALSSNTIDKFLRSYEETGYTFIAADTDNTWIVAYQLPEWDAAWSIVVALEDDPDGLNLIRIGTTVATSGNEPSPELMAFLLDANVNLEGLGYFSIYKDDKYYVQYYVKFQSKYAKLAQIIEAIGFIAGYAETIESTITEKLKARVKL